MNNKRDSDSAVLNGKVRPPLKWAGSKYRIIDRINAVLPKGKRLVEPFVGSGALFLNTHHPRYLINDRNADLASFYRILKRQRNRFVEASARYFSPRNNTEAAYYRFRNLFNSTTDPFEKACLFLYLNKHGYNGLCRYNASGEWNVPFGRYSKPYFPDAELRHALTHIQKARIESRDFADIMAMAERGDVIYCDPPYVPLSSTSNFTAYSAGGFSRTDQERLARVAEETANRGIPVVISNHATGFTESIYRNGTLHRFSVRRLISCNSDKREHADELLAVFT